jgi:hypothetical protein
MTAFTGLFSAGRLLFWMGYQHGAPRRALGFGLTFYPTIAALLITSASMTTALF